MGLCNYLMLKRWKLKLFSVRKLKESKFWQGLLHSGGFEMVILSS